MRYSNRTVTIHSAYVMAQVGTRLLRSPVWPRLDIENAYHPKMHQSQGMNQQQIDREQRETNLTARKETELNSAKTADMSIYGKNRNTRQTGQPSTKLV